MKALTRIMGATALFALPFQAIAAEANDPKCVTREELRTGITYVMPGIIEGVVSKCRPALSSESYLAAKGDDLLDRYKSAANGSAEAALALIGRFAPFGELKGVDAKGAQALIDAALLVGLQSAIQPEYCKDISEGMAYFDPLPAANLIGLFEFIAVKVDETNAKKAAQAAQDAKVGRPTRSVDKPFLCKPAMTAEVVPAAKN